MKRRAQNFVDRVTPNKIEFRGPQSVCHGDSGGPSFAQFQGQMLLIGIHSVVSNPCGRFGVDMRVDFYLDWIRQQSDVRDYFSEAANILRSKGIVHRVKVGGERGG